MRAYVIEHGKISSLLKVENCAVRFIEANSSQDEDDDLSGYTCQGHITNISSQNLKDLCIDVSYFGAGDKFLGLDKTTSMLDIDEIASGETLPFSISLDIPEGTKKLILNATAKRNTLFSKFF